MFEPVMKNNMFRALCAIFLLLCLMNTAQAAVAFRAAASTGQASGGTITVAKPAGTVSGDVMLASVTVVTNVSTVATPTGWTLLLDTNQTVTNTNTSRLYTYYKVAGAAEPTSYAWTVSGTNIGAVAAIASFSGVDISVSPIDASAGQATASSVDHTAPSVTTTVAGGMLVTVHEFASARTWLPPSGMTEIVDRASRTKNGNGVSLEMNIESRAVTGATGTRTATAAGNKDRGAAHSIALKAAPVIPGDFNIYDTSTTPAAAIDGQIKTKIAAQAFTLDIAALNTAKTALLTTFTGTVKFEWLNASDNSGTLDLNNCRSTWTTIQTLSPNPTFVAANNGRLTTASFSENNVYRDVRVRVSFPATGTPSKIGCSTDNFAIRPASFTGLTVKDADALTAGTARSLTNITATGGVVHKAGRPFRIDAVVQNAAGTGIAYSNTAGSYYGLPQATPITCMLPATGCTLGVLDELGVATAWTAGASTGSFYSVTASYDDAGSFTMQLVDSTFAAVDAGDGTTLDCAGMWICSSATAINVGRFVPDHFDLVDASTTDPLVDPLVDNWLPLAAPQFRTFNLADASCNAAALAPKRSFTYIGQPFGYIRVPQATYKAMDANGTPIGNYSGTLMKLTTSGITQTYTAVSGTPDTALALATPTLTPNINYTNGLLSPVVGTIAVNTADKLAFVRSNTTPAAPFNAAISLSITAQDSSESAVAGNGTIDTTTAEIFNGTGTGISFDSGVGMRFGRLKLTNAYGSELLNLPIPIQTQYWSGVSFVTNTADSCTTLAAGNVKLTAAPAGVVATVGGVFSSGVGSLTLSRPSPAAPGAVGVCVDLGADPVGGTVCSATASANLPYLQGLWSPGSSYNNDPGTRATFGIYKGSNNFIYLRENY